MLEANVIQQLETYLKLLKFPLHITATISSDDASMQMQALLKEIQQCAPNITLDFNGNHEFKPSFGIARVVNGQTEAPRVYFAGIPLGHEFTSLLLALLHVGGHPPKIDAEHIQTIQTLAADKNNGHFTTVISLSCHNCPDVVQAFNTIAALNPNFTHTMVDGALFQQWVEEKNILAVPSVFKGQKAEEPFGSGRMSLEEILSKIDTQSSIQEAAKLNARDAFDVLIVGGGPAGAAAAIYAARKGVQTGIVTQRFGGQVLDTLGIENFISVQETEGPRLVAQLEQHVKSYHVDIMTLQQAKDLQHRDGLVHVELENGATLKSKTVILSTGARWRELNVPGEQTYKNRGVAYCPHCDGPLFKGKKVAVIGGGNSGVEAAIDLAGIVAHVTLLEYGEQLRADAVLQNKLKSLNNVTIITQAQTTEVLGNGKQVNALQYLCRKTNVQQIIELDGVFVQIGLLPNTDWLKGTLELSRHGEIIVDEKGSTSMNGVFAAGDCTTTPYKQIIIAMGEGSKTALSAFDHLIRHS